MNSTRVFVRSDDELLRLAGSILGEQGFHVEVVGDGIDLVLAENKYFVVAVVATNTVRDLIMVEPMAFDALAQRTASATLGPKKWDTYLVLLTQERPLGDEDVTRELYAINYDTSRSRRIAHTGVDPTPDDISRALAPFLEPATPATSAVHSDPLASLLEALVSRGVDADLAQRAVTAFNQGASLDDIL